MVSVAEVDNVGSTLDVAVTVVVSRVVNGVPAGIVTVRKTVVDCPLVRATGPTGSSVTLQPWLDDADSVKVSELAPVLVSV